VIRRLQFLIIVFCSLSGKAKAQSEQGLLDLFFTAPMDTKAPSMLYEEIDSLQKLNSTFQRIFPFPTVTFYDCYNSLKVSSVAFMADSLAYVDVDLDGNTARAMCYFKPTTATQTRTAVFLVPGSGNNQSGEIYRNTLGNYHNYNANTETYRDLADIYIYIKPNEDILALHHNGKKLNWPALTPHLLTTDRSYASNYLTQCLGFIRSLKQQYDRVILAGLSQGSMACAVLAFISEPVGAVLASGYTILFDEDYYADLNQVLMPDLFVRFSKENVHEIMTRKSTYYLLSYAKDDAYHYSLEQKDSITYKYFKDTEKVFVTAGHYTHTFPPVSEMRKFLIANVDRPLATFSRVTDCNTFTDGVAIASKGALPITFTYRRDDDPPKQYSLTSAADTLYGLEPGRWVFSNPSDSAGMSVYQSAVIVRSLEYPQPEMFSIDNFQYDFSNRTWKFPWQAEHVALSFINSIGDTISFAAGAEIALPTGHFERLRAQVNNCIEEMPLALDLERPFLSAYPNPVESVLTIEVNLLSVNNNEFQARIYDMTGRLEGAYQLIYGQNDLDFSDVAPGLYLIKVNDTYGGLQTNFKIHKK
jgi:hypothetical protein